MTSDAGAAAPARVGLARRVVGYILVGGLSLIVSYVLTAGLKSVIGIQAAAVIAWIAAVLVAFAVNRRVTFGLSGADRRWRELALFTLGALGQLALTLGGYAVTLGWLRWNFNLAFALNILTTTIFGFAYVNLIAFRRAR